MPTPPHYVPVNEYVYGAALSGCVAGAIGSQPITSIADETYSETADNAVAFAEEFDTIWGTASLDVVQFEAILDSCTSYWRGRIPQSSVPSEYEDICDALITMVNEADAAAIAAGASPPAWPPSDGPSTETPLARTWNVDGLTTALTRNGSASNPFTKFSEFLAAMPLPNTGADDANTMFLGLLSPSPKDTISEALTIPAYRSVTLKCLAQNVQAATQGSALISAIAWHNTSAAADGGTAPASAAFVIDNLNLLAGSSVTITDDATVPSNLSFFGNQTPGAFGAQLVGNVDGTAATALSLVYIDGFAITGNINIPHSGLLTLFALIEGNVTCEAFNARNTEVVGSINCTGTDLSFQYSTLAGGTITAPNHSYVASTFFGVSLAGTGAVKFDELSYASFLAGGGTIAGTLVVTVQGRPARGYTTGAYPQALEVTPSLGTPGTPIAAFNLTAVASGLIELAGTILVSPTTGDAPEFQVVVVAGSSTGGVAGGVNMLFGDDANPLTVPASPTLIATFENNQPASVAQGSTTLACQTQVARGAAFTVVVYAISHSGTDAWTMGANLRCYEASN